MSWMVVRQAFGGEYWETISFGPMTEAEAREMVVGRYGGFALPLSEWTKAGGR